jgi:hypothetical protein
MAHRTGIKDGPSFDGGSAKHAGHSANHHMCDDWQSGQHV